MSVHRFLIVIEEAGDNYSAYSPDLPGCVATGATREGTESNMFEAIQMHVEGLREDGLPVPESTDTARDATLRVGAEVPPTTLVRRAGAPSFRRGASAMGTDA